MPDPDDDKTVIPQRTDVWASAPAADPAPPEADDHNALPVGSRVAEFEVKAIIGIGGFGIVYLAHDHSLGRDVALKEYLPTALAYRNGPNVSVKTARHADTFAAGLASFINEARVLAQFDNPSLVKVYRFWNENGTAYMVMPYYEGPTLKQALEDAAEPPTEAWLKDMLGPLMSALQLLHSENYFHRDIAPDNILLVKGKRPILLDFGAARRVIAGSSKAVTVILKPGYAPIEQYSDTAEMTQGAWTDIYALAAVMHFAIMGQPPVASVSRLIKDTATPLAQAAAGRYGDAFLRGIDKALSVHPAERPQTIAQFRELLGLHDSMAEELPRVPESRGTQTRGTEVRAAPKRRLAVVALGGLAGAAVLAGLAVVAFRAQEKPPAERVTTAPAPPPPAISPPATPAPTPATAPAPAAAPATPPADAGRPFKPADALAQVFEQRDPNHAVAVTLERTTVRVGKDRLRFQVQSDKPGFLYVLMLGTDRQHISLLFPNAIDRKNEAKAGEPIKLPRAGWAMTAGGPPGTNDFIALVSERPRDFGQVGLTKVGPFAELSMDGVAALFRTSPATTPVLAGTPVCAGGGPCPTAYGAARFTIEEVN